MHRRYFEHVYNELCVAANRRISRYDLWLVVWEGGRDPDELGPDQARYFVEHNLEAFLLEEGVALDRRTRRRLERSILRFDPRHPTPEEWMLRVLDQTEHSA
jgi:hypothetical protein